MTGSNEQETGEIKALVLNGEGLRNLAPGRLTALGEMATAFGLNLEVVRQTDDERVVSYAKPQSEISVYVGGEPPVPESDNLTLVGLSITAHTAILEFDKAVERQRQVRDALASIPDITGSLDFVIKHGNLGTGEPFQSDPEKRRQQAILDASILETLPALMWSTHNLENRIKDAGFATLSDILVAGTDRFVGNRLGPVAHNKVQRALHAINPNDPRLNIKNAPTMAEIVEICPTLDTLPAFLIDNKWNYRGKRLVDVITMPHEQLLEFIGQPEAHQQILQEGRRIAFEYLMAQEMPVQDRGEEQRFLNLLGTQVAGEIEKFAKGAVRTRVQNCLEREGIITLAHILIAGRERVADIRNLGDGGVGIIKTMMTSFGLMDNWKEAPTITDIASYCSSLAELPSFLIPDLPGKCIKMGLNDILTMQATELADVCKVFESDEPDLARAESVKNKAQEIADMFLAARRRRTGAK